MNSWRGILIATACAFVTLPASAVVEISESVEYLASAAPDAAGCAWEAGLVSNAVASSRVFVITASKPAAPAGTSLSLQIAQLKLARASKESEYSVVVRGNVVANGKLLATRDFQDEASFKNDRPACEALRTLGASLGQAVAEWVAQTRFMTCADDCVGIHPDEPIAVGARILIANDDAINETVRDECRFPTVMVAKLVAAFNDSDPPPRAKLVSRAIDIESYTGRRLVLRVNNVHALGGGGITGPKWMELSGELWDGKTVVGDFHSYTASGRGLTTCRSVDSLSDSSADLIAQWLRSPSMGAFLK